MSAGKWVAKIRADSPDKGYPWRVFREVRHGGCVVEYQRKRDSLGRVINFKTEAAAQRAADKANEEGK